MKKITSIALAVFAAGAAHAHSTCSSTTGFYAGIGGAFRNLNSGVNFQAQDIALGGTLKDKYKWSSSTGVGTVVAGYGRQGLLMPNFYIGAEFVGSFGRNRSTYHAVDNAGNGYMNTLKHTTGLGGDLRLGYVQDNKTIWYVKAGSVSGKFKQDYVDLTDIQAYRHFIKNYRKSAFNTGLGVETRVGKFRVRGEVTHAWFSPVKFKDVKVRAGQNPVTSFGHPRTFSAMVGAAYCW